MAIPHLDLALTAYLPDGSNTSPATGTCDDDRFAVLIYADNKWHILREWNNTDSEYVYNNIATAGATISGINLSEYYGKTVQLAFYCESTISGNGDNDIHIDNVAFGTPAPAGTEIDVPATDSPANLENLQAGKKYEVKVVPNCNENLAIDWVQFNEELAIAYSEGAGEMPLSFRAKENGTYTLSFSSENTEFNYLHLIDNMTGTDIDLLQTPSYTFDAHLGMSLTTLVAACSSAVRSPSKVIAQILCLCFPNTEDLTTNMPLLAAASRCCSASARPTS